jgi:hypothetical protein
MKNLLRACALLTAITLISTTSHAQLYKFSADARMGAKTYGISTRYFASNVSAIEGIFTMSHNHSRYLFTGLYEEHFQLGNIEGLTWFAGAGMHVGYSRIRSTDLKNGERIYQYYQLPEPATKTVEKDFIAGVDVIGGLEYKFNKVPIHIGIDVKPYVDFMNSESSIFDGGVRIGFAF